MPIAKTAKDLGRIIRARRKELSLDQAQLAKQVGVSRQWLIDIEKGKPRAELGLVLRTLNALDLSMHLNQMTTPDSHSADRVDTPEKRASAQVDIGQIVERNTASLDDRFGYDVRRALQEQDSILGLVKQLSPDIPDDLQALVGEYTSATELAKQLNEASSLQELVREHTDVSELANQLRATSYDPNELMREHAGATELAKQLAKAIYDPQELIRQHDSATKLANQLNMLDPLSGLRKRDPT